MLDMCVCVCACVRIFDMFFLTVSVLIPAVEKSETDLKLHFFNNCFDNKYSTGI